ncbi:hypothetical protein GGI12_000891 [Dipsacomyces acuminosporus]|nr:hypothetical protein GGI12_000891 [Dipsacomyces acuminosporus]
MISSSSTLHIIPDTPDITLYGAVAEARGTILSGRAVLSSRTPQSRRIKSLTVTLRSQREKLFQSASSLAPPTNLTCVLIDNGTCNPAAMPTQYDRAKGQQEWRFSIYVPGSLNETVFTTPAFVAYELVAEIKFTSTFFQGSLTSKPLPIAVKRAPLADSVWAAIASEPMNVSAMWRDRVELTAMTRSRIVHDQEEIKVDGVIRPLIKGLRLLRVGFQIRQYVEAPLDGMVGVMRLCQTVAKTSRQVSGPASCTGSEDGIELSMEFPHAADDCKSSAAEGILIDQEISVSSRVSTPEVYKTIQFDIPQGPVKVTHDLVFAASVVDEQGQVHNVRLSSGVFVLPQAAPSSDGLLPRYEDVWSDTLLLAAGQQKALATHATIFESHAASIFSTELCFDSSIPPPVYSSPICTYASL